ncbi:MAG: ISLre2 family transposase [Chloroflexi bacterium]|nr:ISLre2 family transposase [Chloroflexota bacterium]
MEVEGFRQRRVVTLFGDVVVRRRLYRDKEGKRRFLLDEALGLDKRSPLSPQVRELSALLGSYLPFGKCEQLLRKLIPDGVSHTTIHRQVARVTGPALAREEEEVEEVFEQGKAPEVGKREVPLLLVEGDGVSVALQREKARRAEVKVGIAYEGWEAVGQRHRLKQKTVYMGIMGGEGFWEGFSLRLAKEYDLAKVGQVVVGGDGAPWVKQGAELIGGVYQLDRFHLRRALLRGLGADQGLAQEVYRACVRGDVSLVDRLLLQDQAQASGERAQRIAELRAYILENAGGLVDYRVKLGIAGLRGMGAIEGNVDKLVASRMKKRGMSWTIRGAQRMARLIQMQHEGDIPSWRDTSQPRRPAVVQGPAPSPKPTNDQHDPGAWLNVNLPALQGPHHNRPWALALRRMAHTRSVPGFRPTKP